MCFAHRRFVLLAASLLAGSAIRAGADPVRPTRYELDVRVDFAEERVEGSARVTILNETAEPVRELSFRLYRLLAVSAVRAANGTPLEFSQTVVAFDDDPKRQANVLRVLLPTALAAGAS